MLHKILEAAGPLQGELQTQYINAFMYLNENNESPLIGGVWCHTDHTVPVFVNAYVISAKV